MLKIAKNLGLYIYIYIYIVQWCLRQEGGNNLCAYYVYKFMMAQVNQTPTETLRVRYMSLFIIS